MTRKERKKTRNRRARRVRSRVRGTSQCPRLSVFRSGRHISAQLIDDTRRVTVASASDAEAVRSGKKTKPARSVRGPRRRRGSPNTTSGPAASSGASRRERAEGVGARIAERARAKGIERVRFDRGGYRYHGLVAAVAEGARKGGLIF